MSGLLPTDVADEQSESSDGEAVDTGATPADVAADASTDTSTDADEDAGVASAEPGGSSTEPETAASDAAPAGAADGDIRVCWLDDDDADTLIGALSSGTARTLLSALHDSPSTASELADAADTSVQNVRHHLGNLQDAGLVEDAGTRYSVKGREMTVYAPADERVVVAVGNDTDRSSFLDSLKGLIGTLAVLGVGAAAVEWAFGLGAVSLTGPASAPRVGDAVSSVSTGPLLGLVSPGAAFIAGGLLVLATVFVANRLRAE
ncbi:ArsR/SmtB family transcription factor [Halobaculum sp. P14]|uniref:ArsR/SmtB family transcription factor n=1 Tax=Halobaculum sp. P14 TaxID=3421638 RepID=UPI003EBFEC0B